MKYIDGKVLTHEEFKRYILGKHYPEKKKKKSKKQKVKPPKALKREKVNYYEYIKSEKWKVKRDHIINLFNGRCFDCGGVANQVHHLTYKNLGYENDDDLIPLCSICHQGRHELLSHQR